MLQCTKDGGSDGRPSLRCNVGARKGQLIGEESVSMAVHITPQTRRSLLARLIGPFTVLVLLGSAAASDAVQAATVCGDRDEILKKLEQRHEEMPSALGLSADGGVLELLVSPEGGWTILMTYPKRPTCVVAVGEAWQPLQLAGRPA
jgi:hypothetical protein